MHWPGANVLLFAGFIIVLVTVLAAAFHLIKFLQNRPGSFWFRTVTGLSAIFLISLGFIFRIFYLPGANIIYGLGTIILNFIFLPAFFYHLYKYGFTKTGSHEAV
ncbi:MAG TPA: hypothetical protein VEB42_07205 [Chitinophagaceae bacterium]|nr:hypothetical protein [Chitinophagaceae bacterium]